MALPVHDFEKLRTPPPSIISITGHNIMFKLDAANLYYYFVNSKFFWGKLEKLLIANVG
jgi:hypothetical protein